MNNIYIKKIRNLFGKITHDPFIDWGVIIIVCCAGILGMAAWSFINYQKVVGEINTDYVATSTKVVIDIQKLNTMVETYDTKKVIFESATMPKIDVRDPSL